MSLDALAETVGLLTDQQMIDAARELCAKAKPDRYMGEAARPIAGSDQDQHTPGGHENPLWEIVRWMPARPYYGPGSRLDPDGHWASSLDNGELRRAYALGLGRSELCARYTWSIPSPGDITWLAAQLGGRAVVEIGAGAGYWAWQLTQAGVDVTAYDPHPPGPDNKYAKHRVYHPVRPGDHENAAEHPDRALMLCWPSYGAPFAKQALHHYQGDTVIYIGESEGGCCADDRFHRILARDFEETGRSPFHVTYWGIHCTLTVWRRKGAASPLAARMSPRTR